MFPAAPVHRMSGLRGRQGCILGSLSFGFTRLDHLPGMGAALFG